MALLTVAVVASIFSIRSAYRLSGPPVAPNPNATATPQVPSPSAAPSKTKPGQISQAEWDKRIAESQKRSDEAQLNLEEKRKTLQAAMAKFSEKITPEMQRQGTDIVISAREPRYRALFESWNLDPATSDQALAILREREVQLTEQRIQFFKGTVDLTEISKGLKSESLAADRQLADLLGPDHFAEFSHEDAKMAAEWKRQAEELRRKRAGN